MSEHALEDTKQMNLSFAVGERLKASHHRLPDDIGRYPVSLTDIPLFKPVKDRSKHDTTVRKPERMQTTWGEISRVGPGLNIYDQSTLIAIIQLAGAREIVAPAASLPIPIKSVKNTIDTTVLYGRTTVTAINRFLGRSTNGQNLNKTRESIERLATTLLTFTDPRAVVSDDLNPGVSLKHVKLFDHIQAEDIRGGIEFQLHPMLAQLLKFYGLIDMNVRSELNELGKAVQVYLAGVRTDEFDIDLDQIAGQIGFSGEIKEFKRKLVGRGRAPGQLERMKANGFLRKYRFDKYRLTGIKATLDPARLLDD